MLFTFFVVVSAAGALASPLIREDISEVLNNQDQLKNVMRCIKYEACDNLEASAKSIVDRMLEGYSRQELIGILEGPVMMELQQTPGSKAELQIIFEKLITPPLAL